MASSILGSPYRASTYLLLFTVHTKKKKENKREKITIKISTFNQILINFL